MSIEVKILKSSCCTTGESLTKKLKEASANADIDIHLEILTNLKETMKYGVVKFPSVVIDGDVFTYDEINDSQGLEQILKDHSKQ